MPSNINPPPIQDLKNVPFSLQEWIRNVSKLVNNSGVLGVTSGGTGLSTVTTGDILYGSAPNVLSSLPIGAIGEVLTVNGAGTLPEWGSSSSSLTIGDPINSGTANRVLYEDSSNNLAESTNFTFNGTDVQIKNVLTVGDTNPLGVGIALVGNAGAAVGFLGPASALIGAGTSTTFAIGATGANDILFHAGGATRAVVTTAGQLQVPGNGIGSGITISDTQLYRSAADTIRTPDSVIVDVSTTTGGFATGLRNIDNTGTTYNLTTSDFSIFVKSNLSSSTILGAEPDDGRIYLIKRTTNDSIGTGLSMLPSFVTTINGTDSYAFMPETNFPCRMWQYDSTNNSWWDLLPDGTVSAYVGTKIVQPDCSWLQVDHSILVGAGTQPDITLEGNSIWMIL